MRGKDSSERPRRSAIETISRAARKPYRADLFNDMAGDPMRKSLSFIAAAIAAWYPAYLPAAVLDGKPVVLAPTHRVEPEFPRAALRAGTERGAVTARLALDSDGIVTQVDIVRSEPKRIFDQAVSHALSQWRYPEGRSGRIVEVEVGFTQK
jgi:TonB family protein